MFGLGKHGPDGRYGAIIDIGSGSVGVAIVVSDPTQKYPEIIWTHRERMIIRQDDSIAETSKYITTTLVNTFLTIGTEGVHALTEHDPKGTIEHIQVGISAPWSYTVTKTVSYQEKQSFKITKKLIDELIQTAQRQAMEILDEQDIVEKLGLQLITRATINLTANNYRINQPFGQEANSVSVSHVSAISSKRLVAAIDESSDKILPKANIERYSFMLIFYCVLRQRAHDTTEVCLVDVTHEATEIGIVRDGILRYVTHVPFGTYSIARDIVKLCGVPTEEALAYIRGNSSLEATLSESKRAELSTLISTYEKHIVDLFKRTGDALTIPRSLFLHTDARTESFFCARIKNAANTATRSEHNIHLVTSKLLEETESTESALLLSAYFFHKLHGCDDFEQA